jgi:hydrogenase maturation protease
MLRLLIIGIGNPLRSDDGLGWRVAGDLLRELLPDGIQVIAAQQLTPELSELASRAQQVLFIDAACSGEPGTFKCDEITPASAAGHSHALEPAGLLKLAQQLYGRSPQAHLLTIAAESFATGDTLSTTVTTALPALKAQIRKFMEGNAKEENG